MFRRNRVVRTAALIICLFASVVSSRAAQVDTTWIGGAGLWNVDALWSPPLAPNNGVGGNTYRVFIDNGNAVPSEVVLNINTNVDQLTVTTGDSLLLADGISLAAISIVNDGSLFMNSTGTITRLHPFGAISLNGSGELVMTNNSQNQISGVNGTNPTLNHGAGHTIRGAGKIGLDILRLVNSGLIQADQPTKLSIDTVEPGQNTNTGTMQAVGSSTLELLDSVLVNTNGSIRALDNSIVEINNVAVNGGALHTESAGVISPNNGAFQSVTLTGLLRHDNARSGRYLGTNTNNGTIALNSTGSLTRMYVDNTGVAFNGTGQIVMSNSLNNLITYVTTGANPQLVNGAEHTIRGAGQIGLDGVRLTNHGLIQADQPTRLIVDLSPTGLHINTGIMQAIGTSTLEIAATNLTNTDGVIQALGSSTVDIILSTISGGLLSADPGCVLSPSFATFQNINLTGLMRHDNGEDATYEGTIANNGTISLNSTGSATEIAIPNGTTTTFTGAGQIVMSNNANNLIRRFNAGAPPTLVNGADHLIRGAGNIGLSDIHITNNGTIIADQMTPLIIDVADTGQGLINNGTINVTGSGGLFTWAGSFTSSGTVNVASGKLFGRTGTYVQTGGTTTINGTATASGGGFSIQGGMLTGNGSLSGGLVANSGTIAPGDPIGRLTLNNALSLNASGIVAFEIGGLTPITQHDQIIVNGVTQLNGELHVNFVNGFDPQIGDSFVIMTYPDLPPYPPGNFDNLDVPCNLVGKRVQVEITNSQVIVRIIAFEDFVDVNCDCGYSMQSEVQALILSVLNPTAYDSQYPGCTGADVNGDGQRNGKDVQAFVNQLLN